MIKMQHNQCAPTGLRGSGYQSHIRGHGSSFLASHIFPGTQMIGNEAGANASILAQNADCGHIVEIKRRYDGGHPWHNVYPPRR